MWSGLRWPLPTLLVSFSASPRAAVCWAVSACLSPVFWLRPVALLSELAPPVRPSGFDLLGSCVPASTCGSPLSSSPLTRESSCSCRFRIRRRPSKVCVAVQRWLYEYLGRARWNVRGSGDGQCLLNDMVREMHDSMRSCCRHSRTWTWVETTVARVSLPASLVFDVCVT